MKSSVYYGEYSLDTWIELMLTGNIGLPKYQRVFVWNKRDILRLMQSLKDGEFVQPITIARNKKYDPSNYKNLVLDGQQRLTAILLYKLQIMPNKKGRESEQNAQEEIDDDRNDSNEHAPIDWTFEEIVAKYNEGACFQNLVELSRSLCEEHGYEKMARIDDDNFFKNTYLAFSYIVPEEQKPEEVQRCYTQLFRNINYYGKQLSPMESRRSLYYTNSGLKDYFEGIHEGKDVLCDIRINENYKSGKIDFIRYLATLSEYYVLNKGKRGTSQRDILKGYSAYSSRESYYADYVSFLLGMDQEENTEKFDGFKFKSIFPNDEWRDRYNELKKSVSLLKGYMNLDKKNKVLSFNSWIDADYWLFGLVYHIVFMGKTLKGDMAQLSNEINGHIHAIKKDNAWDSYKKAPNRLAYIRHRLSKSLTIYKRYVH